VTRSAYLHFPKLLTAAALAVFTLITSAPSAFAAGPSAIVEEVSYETGDLLAFDYLFAGREIAVPTGQRLVIGYLSSCVRETVTGGTIRIGVKQSEGDAAIAREAMSCAGAAAVAGADASATALTAIFRGGDKEVVSGDRPVNSTLPVFLAPHNASTLSVSRLDADGPEVQLDVSGGVVDMAAAGAAPLQPAGVYFASAGTAFVEFAVSATAQATGGPATPRLVRLR
jgi:hypothetical protein